MKDSNGNVSLNGPEFKLIGLRKMQCRLLVNWSQFQSHMMRVIAYRRIAIFESVAWMTLKV